MVRSVECKVLHILKAGGGLGKLAPQPAEGVMGMPDLELTTADEAVLGGSDGPGHALAMRVVVQLARVLGAGRLLSISSAHIDSCLYHGTAGLDFATRLVELGARVRVPTTLNVGSVDLLHPGLVRAETARERDVATRGRELMGAYSDLGCTPTWTCAPYQLPSRPRLGEHIAWAESNAIVFANSVLGARTDRYGDFLDICAAITGRAPDVGLHRDAGRRGEVLVDCRAIPDRVLRSDLTYPVLGYLVGTLASTRNPVIDGLPPEVTEDQLKALGAAAASSGGVALFHAVGITPEAPTVAAALHGLPAEETHVLTLEHLRSARARLCTVTSGPLDAVSLGTPHASAAECRELAAALRSGPPLHPAVDCYISTGRAILQELRDDGSLSVLEDAGVKVVVDTCTYVTSILSPKAKVVMTNSGKWAHYAPANIGVDVVIGSLAECVASALAGQITLLDPWRDGTR